MWRALGPWGWSMYLMAEYGRDGDGGSRFSRLGCFLLELVCRYWDDAENGVCAETIIL